MGCFLSHDCYKKQQLIEEEDSSLKGTSERSSNMHYSEPKSLRSKTDPKLSREGIPEKKVLLVGDQAVGKSSIIERYTKGKYSEDGLKNTLGANFAKQKVTYKNDEVYLNIWDTAGDKKFLGVSEIFYKGTDVVIIVYDCSNPETYNNVRMWLEHVQSNLNILEIQYIALVSNKSDLKSEKNTAITKMAKTYAKDSNMKFFETSAKSGEGVSELFNSIARHLIQRSKI